MVYYVQLLRGMTASAPVTATLDTAFSAAVDIVQNLPKEGSVTITNDEKLLFYSLYKQATIGSCNTPRPPFWNVVGKYKWESWIALGAMDSAAAKQNYIDMLKKIVDQAMTENDFAFLLSEGDSRLEDILRPNFELLSYDWRAMFSRPVKEQQFGSGDGAAHTAFTGSVEKRGPLCKPSESFDSLSDCNDSDRVKFSSRGCSDDDYDDATDAVEPEDTIVEAVAGEESKPRNRVRSEATGISTCIDEQREACKGLAALTVRLSRMMEILAEQQKLFSSFVQRFRSQMGKPTMSWKVFIFLIVWPIIVNLLLRYLPYIRALF